MKNSLFNSLFELHKVLGELHELDWFHTLGNNVNYQQTKYIDMVKPKVEYIMGGLSILYLFAIFETYFEVKEWDVHIKSSKLFVLRAYRHVRHCIAHGHHGQRVKPIIKSNIVEYEAFNEVIKNDLFFPKNIIELDPTTNTIKILPSVGIHLREFLRGIVSEAIVSVHTS